MILEKIAVSGFRGINKLSLRLEENNVLIGENAWGKSSLLDALTLLLAPGEPYQFSAGDFHSPPGDNPGRERHIQIRFTFREFEAGQRNAARYAELSDLWQRGEAGTPQLCYQVLGERLADGTVITRHHFLDELGKVLAGDGTGRLRTLKRLHPVLRLRDARFNRRMHLEPTQHGDEAGFNALVAQIDTLTRDLHSRPQSLTDSALRQGLRTMQQLLEHYFSLQQPSAASQSGRLSHQMASRSGWRYLDNINRLIAEADSRSRRVILLRMFALLLQVRGAHQLDAQARPLLLIEDPETRLHPVMLAVAWGLLNLLPLQKITTTNSGELLSQVPVEQVCRLVREPERVAAWRIGPGGLSAEESRRIAFHIRFNRPSSLFARCWLLVEGETEVWIMNELARQCGHHFAAEGVKVIEFAQCGLRPLLTFAGRMGIEWHVLTDGDDAGRKYAATAHSLLDGEPEQQHLTQLPALDMEHFLYRQGFSEVYHRIARLPSNVPMNLRRIIAKAVHHSSKPELAIAVAMDAAERGSEAVPALLRKMFARVQWLAHGKTE
ncbi:conserved uncharacterized protein YbjD [Erwinia sp. Ejp617]|nr:ATP-dependent endonuclease [Erwinia sp. Ejp617]ADP12108.1 conserved uncharacterized protein YbjD [Erwinia sp. Ejp617]